MTNGSLKRYNAFSGELKRIFGAKVQRISVDAGFTCPNRDGTLDSGGCIFCGGHGSGSHGILRDLDVAGQLEDGKEVMRRKYKAEKFLAYFQSYSNTYAHPERLRKLFDQALIVPDIVGLIVATRPDCVPDNIMQLLFELSNRTYFWLELGLQSIHDRSLIFMNRRHDYACSLSAVERAHEIGLRVCAHVILGLPGESRSDMIATIDELNRTGVEGVKLHLMHVMKDTPLAGMYEQGRFPLMERDEYVSLVCDVLEHLNPSILIHRLTGDGGRDTLVAPRWSLKKFEVLNLIDGELERRGTRQGTRYAGNF